MRPTLKDTTNRSRDSAGISPSLACTYFAARREPRPPKSCETFEKPEPMVLDMPPGNS